MLILGRWLTPECIEAHDLRRGVGRLGSDFGCRVVIGRLFARRAEAEAERYVRIGKGGDCGERHMQCGGDAAKRQDDAEPALRLIDREVPELVLQHDRHFMRVLGH